MGSYLVCPPRQSYRFSIFCTENLFFVWVEWNDYVSSLLSPLHEFWPFLLLQYQCILFALHIFRHSLHACARFNPPVEIVKLLIELVPESPSLVDCLNRTPLHVAVGTRANFSSIRLLAGAYPEACAVLDEDGKTPLHLACDSACELFKGDESCEREPPSFDVVSMIASLCPWSVPLVNTYGISALEYAIISNAPIKIVHFLQKVTAEQTKNQKILQTAITRNYRVIWFVAVT